TGGIAGSAEAGVTSGGFGIVIVTWPSARSAEAARESHRRPAALTKATCEQPRAPSAGQALRGLSA
ncbi:MAG TPA: hypothetical protein VN961_07105, partial [Streptosporangiaceae bacterium]|nr:hypothetical protein [Streptosporangiaceae bacterium]